MVKAKSEATVAAEVEVKLIELAKITANTAQSRGMGVLSKLKFLGYDLFESTEDEDPAKSKPALWPLFFSELPEERKFIIDLIEEHEKEVVKLAGGLRETGQLQAIGVLEEDGNYDVIFGMTRSVAKAYNYCKFGDNESKMIEAKIFRGSFSPVDLKLMSMDENTDRHDESPIDKAITYQWLQKEGKLTPDEIGKRTRQSGQNIRNYVKLLSKDLADKREAIHNGEFSVDRAMKLLAKRKKEGAEAQEDREPAKREERYRLPGNKGLIKIYEARKKPKNVPDKLWDMYVLPDVRKFLAVALGLKFKPFVPLSKAEEEAENKKAASKGGTNGKVVKVLKVKEERAIQLLVSLGKTEARSWKPEKLKEKLENIVSLVEEGAKAENASLQGLLDKLLEGYKAGNKVEVIKA